jgi:hypothetical protein
MNLKKIFPILLASCLTYLCTEASAQSISTGNEIKTVSSLISKPPSPISKKFISDEQAGTVIHSQLPNANHLYPDNYNRSRRPQTQTLFSSDIRHGGYGSLVYGVTSINGEVAYMRGTRGAWIIHFAENHALQLGLAGYRTHSEFRAVDWEHDDVTEPELRTNYGGFEVEYVNRSYRLVHFGTQLLIGSGNVRYDDRNLAADKTRDNYFVMQPGANMHLNITSWFRISAGVFYRHATNVNLDGTSDRDLSGMAGILGLRFGRF